MKSQADEIRQFLIEQIPNHSQDIVAITANRFKVTRTTVHRHLNYLNAKGLIIKSGTTRQINYYLISQRNKHYTFSVNETLTEDSLWQSHLKPGFEKLSPTLLNILHYGFTEIVNNAIDHANATTIQVDIEWINDEIVLKVIDDGVGIYHKISKAFHFADFKECLLHLTKGRLTTDPSRHSGEGLFFTSRVFDKFYLNGNGISFFRDNLISDWSVAKIPLEKGTEVIMKISITSQRKLSELFNKYTDLDDLTFSKTDLLVDLSQLAGETLISRSQAKRLLANLEPFSTITLDFSKVTTVGQGFADEVFRVYPLSHSQVEIKYIHANPEVEFMIKRAIKTIISSKK